MQQKNSLKQHKIIIVTVVMTVILIKVEHKLLFYIF